MRTKKMQSEIFALHLRTTCNKKLNGATSGRPGFLLSF